VIIALDVHYTEAGAHTVGICFHRWTDEAPSRIYTDNRMEVEPYEPGVFYKRELPCLLGLLQQIDVTTLEAIVIDGYVHLEGGKDGLGAHLHRALGGQVPVIGVAKSRFRNAESFALGLLRGASRVPLWITATGMDLKSARRHIASMAGPHRLPSLLRLLDSLTKTGE
jgi:deoxyribonuclease V